MGIDRQFITRPQTTTDTQNAVTGNAKQLRLMTFNVLAQGLSADSFIKCPLEALQFETRYEAIMEEITKYSADIICLQEVDMFKRLKTSLPGYVGLWKPKPSSPCLYKHGNIGPDGSAMFYKSDSADLLSHHAMPIQADGLDFNQLLLATCLRLHNGHRLLVVCLHLKAGAEFAPIREEQGRFVLEFIESQVGVCDSVIVAGDLNSEPTASVHQLFESAGFVSTYVTATGKHPQFTTCKIRSVRGKETLQRKVEDYIYYKNGCSKDGLIVDRVLEIPAESSLGEGCLPSLHYPSDHLSMVTDFTIP